MSAGRTVVTSQESLIPKLPFPSAKEQLKGLPVATDIHTTRIRDFDYDAPSLQDVVNELNISTLGLIVAQQIFGDDLDNESESLFLTKELDETEPIQGEFAAKLCHLFHENGIEPPETFIFQVFRRKAGFVPKEKAAEYAMAICIKDYQVITHERQDHLLSRDCLSPLFRVSEDNIPRIVPNRTQVKLGNGQATIKTRSYMSMIVWAFWDEYPELKRADEAAPNIQDDEVAKALKSLQTSVESSIVEDSTQEEAPVLIF